MTYGKFYLEAILYEIILFLHIVNILDYFSYGKQGLNWLETFN